MGSEIINKTEAEERQYLEEIKEMLNQAIIHTDNAAGSHAKELRESKGYLWENKAGMDHAEKVSVRQSITRMAISGENAVVKKKRLKKLLANPYFGRIDYSEKGSSKISPLYIGMSTFFDNEENINLIHDWRAPISGMFYDFELGDAYYESPSGKIEGNISLKRQYRIRNGKMEFMIESAVNIHDDILQEELSRNSSEKMNNIVATIQRDQNKIIRNELASILIIQGVAGSGKTSIALHRIAFLLYRFKESIRAEDVLIISPNKVFADYISNVLPELGEEKIPETNMEELADKLLEGKIKFSGFFDQVSKLLENNDKALQERITFKSGFDFIIKLNDYLLYIENECFVPKDFIAARFPVPASYMKEKYQTYNRLPLLKRINNMAQDLVNDMHFYYQYEATAADKKIIKKEVESMFKTLNLRKLYKEFYDWLGRPDLLKMAKGSVYEYSDVFPILYLKHSLEGFVTFSNVKHLVIDEMQDYTPVQYNVISKVFSCNKTILGDSNQHVNPYGYSASDAIVRVFPGADSVKITKSYRSTFEITKFAQRIRQNPDIEAIERHGKNPQILSCKDFNEETLSIKQLIDEFVNSNYKSLGIICKTQSQAESLYKRLSSSYKQIFVLSSESSTFMSGLMITSAHMAKGLEFDQVIVPFCDEDNYKTITDKQMLYVACTRAMHRLDLTFSKNITKLASPGS